MKNKLIDILTRLWLPLPMLLIFATLTVKFACAQSNEISDAQRFIEIDQPRKAVELLTKAAQSSPTPSLWYHLGMAHLKNGDRKTAGGTFEKGINFDAKEPLNYVGRGYLAMLEGNATKAKIDFDKALGITKSKNNLVLLAIADAYLIDNRHVNDALTLLSKAKSIDDHDPEIFILMGNAYLAQNNGGLAVTSYEKAATLNSKLAKPHYQIGLVYMRSRNFNEAEEAFTNAVEIDPSYTLAYKELGELYYQKKEGEKAVKSYKQYLSLTDKPEAGNFRYAFFLFMAKQFTEANKVFENLVRLENVNPVALRFYAFSLYEAGNFQQSRNVFEQYFKRAPQQEIEAADYNYHGRLLQKVGDDSTAIVQFQKSLELERNQPEVLQLQAEALYKQKRYSDAIDCYTKLAVLKSKLASQDLYTLGRAYYFNKQYGPADSVFQKLIELQPNMPIGYLWEARTKSNLDPESEHGLARPYYEAVVEKSVANPEKSKTDLIEAYSYLGYYHFVKQEMEISKAYWKKVLSLNPSDTKAKEALKAIN